MTREEAISFGNMWLELNEDAKDSETYQFFKMAISALRGKDFEGMTNGEAIRSLFSRTPHGMCLDIYQNEIHENEMVFKTTDRWWNAPYQKGGE